MRAAPLVLLFLSVTALALLPGMALAQDESAPHVHNAGPVNPLKKVVALYLDAAGSFGTVPPESGAVASSGYAPGSEAPATLWSITATKNATLASSPFVEFFASIDNPTVIPGPPLGGPNGAAFHIQLTYNGAPVNGSESFAMASSTVLLPGQQMLHYKVFLPQPDNLTLAPGDQLGVALTFYGTNPNGDALSYLVGGDAANASRMALTLRYPALSEVLIPPEVGPWPMVPLEGFDFGAAAKAHPGARVFTLLAHQYGFSGAPVVVDNGTEVILQLYVDEALSTDPNGHAAHNHSAPPGLAWDGNYVTALHGFSLVSFKPGLSTVLSDNLVVTMHFTADKPGNYTFLCTVFCGSGHGGMLDRLEIRGPVPPPAGENPSSTGNDGDTKATTKPAPGPELGLAVGAAALVAFAARRRR